MRFGLTQQQQALRQQVCQFLTSEIAQGGFTPGYDGWLVGWSPGFSRKLAARGWIGMAWPAVYGGRQQDYLDRLIMTEELMRFGAPAGYHWHADRQVGPAILAHGSEEQKDGFLPAIIRADISFCIGMSEPGAGSDLASLATRAEKAGDGYVLNGQKTFITNAHRASFMYLVARTNPAVPKHKGLSEFLVDLKSPGITVRPLLDMTGGHEFNEVFLDNVHLPGDALLGQLDMGWNQVVRQLDYERAGIERLMGNYRLMEDVTAFAVKTERDGRRLSSFPALRAKLAELAVDMEVGRQLIYRVAWMLSRGSVPSYEAAMAKTYGAEFQQRLAAVAMSVLGLAGQLKPGSTASVWRGLAPMTYIRSMMQTIGGGTSEILRNLVALRGLGLPAR